MIRFLASVCLLALLAAAPARGEAALALQDDARVRALVRQIDESKSTMEVERRKLLDKQQDKIEQKRNKYSKKMLEDAKEFSRLQAQKEREY